MIDITTADNTSFFESKIMGSRFNAKSSRIKSRSQYQRSQYNQMVTHNPKFEVFLDAMFKSKMPAVEVKDHIVKYVQALETSYTEAVRDLKDVIDRVKDQHRRVLGEQTNRRIERSELETLFVTCIEEVRKEIMKRRLKNELQNRSQFAMDDRSNEETRDFEESLLRLAQLAKNRVRMVDFTNRDKYHLLDLFVNNEKTLLKIYEALFPNR